ncbi:carbohydrate-binding module family 32 [Dothidotthia symphoricarpi CBS 119687]|uniref:Carbohydrate-binding module family 32 n=1 Tax=Dothidotthia symphoricarpi CBS 119687 TaxID=1392245 RepID=A0A6A6ACP9_9PLEO|nr:carbohydrate-binding module family 32 [Dothidotthia symphoricarpi CBS 119687]KAF2128511.1 carbohydrate-binding module family 32 [Dothidotthia symphoricarpi CBS 119687]
MALLHFSIAALLSLALYTNPASAGYAAISRTGWTATADSSQTGNDPSKAIDNNAATFWHSKYSPAPIDPLPNWIIVDMQATYNVQRVSIQPRTSSTGRIGSHKIEVSTDNTTWQLAAVGTYNNDATTKNTTFVARQARYVKITATSEAQNTGVQLTSIAEINIFQDVVGSTPTPYTPPASGKGLWEKTVDFPLVPAAVSLLPNGKLLVWSAYAKNQFGGSRGYTQTAIYDHMTGESSQLNVSNTQHDMFCPGISLDFNGRVVVTGGSNAAKTSIYDPTGDAWLPAPDMKVQRGYQSSATCSDGRIFTIGGSWSGPRGGKNGEIYDPSTNLWTLIPNALVGPMLTKDRAGAWRNDNHAMLFGWKNSTVFQAGPSVAMNWYDITGTGNTTAAGNRLDDGDSMNGIAVMYDATAGKILKSGGSPHYEDSDATTNAYVITIGTPKTKPTVAKTQNMAYARGFANSVVFPDGTVFVTGGQSTVTPFRDTTAALVPELWNPTSGTWSQLSPMSIPRTYHSVAILLPDATVFQGGGGLCGPCTQYGGIPESNHFDAEIFVPPYLLNADGTRRTRPVISTVASTVNLGAKLSITTDTAVTSFSLIRFGSATHTVNTDQRRIPLTPSGTGTSYTVTVPADPGVALPGYWLLFAMNSAGTPSVGQVVKLTL